MESGGKPLNCGYILSCVCVPSGHSQDELIEGIEIVGKPGLMKSFHLLVILIHPSEIIFLLEVMALE